LLAIPETLLRSTHCWSILSIELENTPQKDGETPDQETGRVVSFRKHSRAVIDYRDGVGFQDGRHPPAGPHAGGRPPVRSPRYRTSQRRVSERMRSRLAMMCR